VRVCVCVRACVQCSLYRFWFDVDELALYGDGGQFNASQGFLRVCVRACACVRVCACVCVCSAVCTGSGLT
jgi:hypothetical protein